MISARLVRLVEDHAEELTEGLLRQLRDLPHPAGGRHVSAEEVRRRSLEVYSHLGRWLGHRSDQAIATTFSDWGRRRHADGVPASDLVVALQTAKLNLERFVLASAGSSAVELYQEEEFHLLVDHFFDKAIYWVVRGYEEALSLRG